MADELVLPETQTVPALRRRRLTWHRVRVALVVAVLAFLFLITVGWMLLTSSAPWVAERPAPVAEQVGAGRAVLNKILRARANGALVGDITINPAELDGFGALAGDMFKPDRAFAQIVDGGVELTMSHHMVGGRWLNIALRAEPSSKGFPPTRLNIGSVSLGPLLSRWTIEAFRQVARLRGVKAPPLNQAIRSFSVTPNLVTINFNVPGNSGMVNELAGVRSRPVDSAATTRIYCMLTAEQATHPSADFPEQVRRTFSYVDPGKDPVEQNRAAFVALSMFAVARQTGDLTSSARNDTRRCRIDTPVVYLQKRPDSPKHWALSAALAAVLGSEPARAAGEWKELSDSLPRGDGLDADDGSGFSFVDIAADRSGFLVAIAATDPAHAREMAQKLADASDGELLPAPLLKEPEGLDPRAFRKAYGGIDEQRYAGVIAAMDNVLQTQGLVPKP